jgi:hypothetical protein
MNILIGGCSWGVGEWQRGDLTNKSNNVLHGGLAQYIKEADHQVVNLSHAGANNTFIFTALRNYLAAESLKNNNYPDFILVFQTEYCRDYGFRFEEDYKELSQVNDLAYIWLARFYSSLSGLAQKYKTKIYIIGGCGDTVWLDNMSQQYPGVEILCQSLVNLLTNDNHRVDEPVYSWYTNTCQALAAELKMILPNDKLDDLIDKIDLGVQRQSLLRLHPEYFWPDGTHPNRMGHKKLYDMLVQPLLAG